MARQRQVALMNPLIQQRRMAQSGRQRSDYRSRWPGTPELPQRKPACHNSSEPLQEGVTLSGRQGGNEGARLAIGPGRVWKQREPNAIRFVPPLPRPGLVLMGPQVTGFGKTIFPLSEPCLRQFVFRMLCIADILEVNYHLSCILPWYFVW